MKFDEKTEKRHKTAIRKLMAHGMSTATKSEIQWELSKRYGVTFDLNYIHRLMLEIQKDAERIMAYLATPEGQAEYLKRHKEATAKLGKLEEEIRSQKD